MQPPSFPLVLRDLRKCLKLDEMSQLFDLCELKCEILMAVNSKTRTARPSVAKTSELSRIKVTTGARQERIQREQGQFSGWTMAKEQGLLNNLVHVVLAHV